MKVGGNLFDWGKNSKTVGKLKAKKKSLEGKKASNEEDVGEEDSHSGGKNGSGGKKKNRLVAFLLSCWTSFLIFLFGLLIQVLIILIPIVVVVVVLLVALSILFPKVFDEFSELFDEDGKDNNEEIYVTAPIINPNTDEEVTNGTLPDFDGTWESIGDNYMKNVVKILYLSYGEQERQPDFNASVFTLGLWGHEYGYRIYADVGKNTGIFSEDLVDNDVLKTTKPSNYGYANSVSLFGDIGGMGREWTYWQKGKSSDPKANLTLDYNEEGNEYAEATGLLVPKGGRGNITFIPDSIAYNVVRHNGHSAKYAGIVKHEVAKYGDIFSGSGVALSPDDAEFLILGMLSATSSGVGSGNFKNFGGEEAIPAIVATVAYMAKEKGTPYAYLFENTTQTIKNKAVEERKAISGWLGTKVIPNALVWCTGRKGNTLTEADFKVLGLRTNLYSAVGGGNAGQLAPQMPLMLLVVSNTFISDALSILGVSDWGRDVRGRIVVGESGGLGGDSEYAHPVPQGVTKHTVYANHGAIDINAPLGTLVRASRSGKVDKLSKTEAVQTEEAKDPIKKQLVVLEYAKNVYPSYGSRSIDITYGGENFGTPNELVSGQGYKFYGESDALSLGRYIKIQSNETAQGGYNYDIYGHLFAIGSECKVFLSDLGGIANVSKNSNVTEGQIIGMMGNSGNSTGTHLHFESRAGARGTKKPQEDWVKLFVPNYTGDLKGLENSSYWQFSSDGTVTKH